MIKKRKKLKDFAEAKKVVCQICGGEVKSPSKLRITGYDGGHFYKGSGRKFINTYGLTLCRKHYKKILNGIDKTISKLYE